MITLSTGAKEAIKVSLAMVIAYWIAMSMGWDKPMWAGFAVVTINMLTVGQSLNKGVMRSLGTVMGAVAALVMIGLFPQERWWMVACLCLYLGLCTYMLTGKKYPYVWFLASFTSLIIIVDSNPFTSQSAFQTAVMRTLETGMGALVYTLVATFLWPRSSVGIFQQTCGQLWSTQLQLYRAYRDLMSGLGTAEGTRPLRMQELQLLNQVEQLQSAAETDSYEVWELRHHWRSFHQQLRALMGALERWRQSFPDIQKLPQTKLFSNLEAFYSELDLRFDQIERMLAGQAPTRSWGPITVTLDKTAMGLLTSFEKAAVIITQAQLEKLGVLSASLFDCLAYIRGLPPQPEKRPLKTSRQTRLSPDPDRIKAVGMVIATFCISFLLWIYINPPGHAGFVLLATIFALILALIPIMNFSTLYLYWGFGIAFAGVLYIFVMPHLSNFRELGLMIFIAYFLMYYWFRSPRMMLARMFSMCSFLILVSIDNQQTYSFSSYANTSLMIFLGMSVALGVAYVTTSPRPEKAFLRLVSRFFRYSEYLLAGLSRDWEQKKSLSSRLKSVFFQKNLLQLPGKLENLGHQIDYRILSDNTPEEVQALVTSLYALAYRIEDLVETCGLHQPDPMKDFLLEDLRSWRLAILERFELRAKDPALAIGLNLDIASELAARLDKMEAKIAEAITRAPKREFSLEDYENFYRVLGSFRGLSDAGIGYGKLADSINWAKWQEERF